MLDISTLGQAATALALPALSVCPIQAWNLSYASGIAASLATAARLQHALVTSHVRRLRRGMTEELKRGAPENGMHRRGRRRKACALPPPRYRRRKLRRPGVRRRKKKFTRAGAFRHKGAAWAGVAEA